MEGVGWGVPISYINPHPESYWITVTIAKYQFDLGAIVADYCVAWLLVSGLSKLASGFLQMYTKLSRQ
jgi:hypothetical protein